MRMRRKNKINRKKKLVYCWRIIVAQNRRKERKNDRNESQERKEKGGRERLIKDGEKWEQCICYQATS